MQTLNRIIIFQIAAEIEIQFFEKTTTIKFEPLLAVLNIIIYSQLEITEIHQMEITEILHRSLRN